MNIVIFVLSDMANFLAEVLFTIQSRFKGVSLLQNLLMYVLSCRKCFGFWMGLIWTQDIFLASLTALIQLSIEKGLQWVENKINQK